MENVFELGGGRDVSGNAHTGDDNPAPCIDFSRLVEGAATTERIQIPIRISESTCSPGIRVVRIADMGGRA